MRIEWVAINLSLDGWHQYCMALWHSNFLSASTLPSNRFAFWLFFQANKCNGTLFDKVSSADFYNTGPCLQDVANQRKCTFVSLSHSWLGFRPNLKIPQSWKLSNYFVRIIGKRLKGKYLILFLYISLYIWIYCSWSKYRKNLMKSSSKYTCMINLLLEFVL